MLLMKMAVHKVIFNIMMTKCIHEGFQLLKFTSSGYCQIEIYIIENPHALLLPTSIINSILFAKNILLMTNTAFAFRIEKDQTLAHYAYVDVLSIVH